jgi:uncharacterized YigZ family protein
MNLFTTNQIFTTELEVKRSKFISYLIPYHLFKEQMDIIKSNHPKARHYVYGYRFLNEFEQIVENQSDDGEPKNSSGRPTLNVMQGSKLINVAIITVRYFGGIKLGVGGLVRAYGDSANLVITSSELEPFIKQASLKVSLSYSNLSKGEYLINKFELQSISKEFLSDRVTISIGLKSSDLDSLKDLLDDISITLNTI